MKNRWKLTALVSLGVLALVFGAQLTVAEGFGSFPRDQSKRVGDLDSTFSIGMINLDNTTRKVILEAPESSSYRVVFEENPVSIEPSDISSTPGSGEWYSLGDGRYARVQDVSFRVEISENAEKKVFSIPIDLAAAYSTTSGGSGAVQKAFQTRSHSFRLETTSQIIRPQADDIYRDGGLIDYAENSSGTKNSSTAADNASMNNSQRTEPDRTPPEKGLTREEKDQNRAVNIWTLIFLAGTVISVVVLLREIS